MREPSQGHLTECVIKAKRTDHKRMCGTKAENKERLQGDADLKQTKTGQRES